MCLRPPSKILVIPDSMDWFLTSRNPNIGKKETVNPYLPSFMLKGFAKPWRRYALAKCLLIYKCYLHNLIGVASDLFLYQQKLNFMYLACIFFDLFQVIICQYLIMPSIASNPDTQGTLPFLSQKLIAYSWFLINFQFLDGRCSTEGRIPGRKKKKQTNGSQ